jgi:hypothetical protein
MEKVNSDRLCVAGHSEISVGKHSVDSAPLFDIPFSGNLGGLRRQNKGGQPLLIQKT